MEFTPTYDASLTKRYSISEEEKEKVKPSLKSVVAMEYRKRRQSLKEVFEAGLVFASGSGNGSENVN